MERKTIKFLAKIAYLRGLPLEYIMFKYDIPRATLYDWRRKGNWVSLRKGFIGIAVGLYTQHKFSLTELCRLMRHKRRAMKEILYAGLYPLPLKLIGEYYQPVDEDEEDELSSEAEKLFIESFRKETEAEKQEKIKERKAHKRVNIEKEIRKLAQTQEYIKQADIRRVTGLPRASISRKFAQLEAEGVLWRDENQYTLVSEVSK